MAQCDKLAAGEPGAGLENSYPLNDLSDAAATSQMRLFYRRVN